MSKSAPTTTAESLQDELTLSNRNVYDIGPCVIDGDYVYNGFSPREKRATDPIEMMQTVREEMANLRETRTLFRKRDVCGPHGASAVSSTYIELCGGWATPDSITQNTGPKMKHVNPDADDAWLYSDAYTVCECGALVATSDGVPRHEMPAKTTHEDCRQDWRLEARTRVFKNRRRIMKRAFRYDWSTRETGHRLGYKDPHLSDETKRHRVDYQTEHELGRKMLANTAALHLPRYSLDDLGEAFGYAGSTMRNIIDSHVDGIDFVEMRSYRHEGGYPKVISDA